MSRDAFLLTIAGVAVLAVVVVLGIGAFGTTRTTVTSGTPVSYSPPPADGSAGVVFDLHEDPGQSIFGITFTSPTYKAFIGMVVPDTCLTRDESGMDMLSVEGQCADLPAKGELTGSGVTPAGGRLAIVQIEISHRCFQAIEIGDLWPTTAPACAS